jgi:ubiquinone/menaquinone biosynthesis C-methylase UbiE
MKIPAEKRDWRRMSAMFTTIAPSYDFFTRVFSYGMDRHWKKVCVERAVLSRATFPCWSRRDTPARGPWPWT